MVITQRKAHPAQMRLPGRTELTAEPVPAGPDDPEHSASLGQRSVVPR
jgi:hypothetical protein